MLLPSAVFPLKRGARASFTGPSEPAKAGRITAIAIAKVVLMCIIMLRNGQKFLMEEFDVAFDRNRDPIALVETSCHEMKLKLHSKGTLKTYAGCTHWHYKLSPSPGTLEITYWPEKDRLWLKIHNRRRAQWIDDSLSELIRKLES